MKYEMQVCHVGGSDGVQDASVVCHVGGNNEVRDVVQVEVQVDVHYNTRRTKSQDQSRAARSVRDDVETECTR